MSLSISVKKLNSLHNAYTFEGSDIHFSLINSIRRTVFSNIDSYSFKKVEIIHNIPIMNKEQLEHRISMLPIHKINIDNKKNMDISNGTLILSINEVNNTDSDRLVTTNDVKLLYNMKSIPNFYDPDNPIIISKLRPGYKLIFNATSEKNTGSISSCFRPGLVYYTEINSNKYILNIESDGYYTPIEILKLSCQYMIKNVELLKNKIGIYIKNSTEQHLTIEIPDEDHTLGNVITSYLRFHQDILFTGYSIDHPYSKKLNIISICKKGKNNIDCINETIDKLIKIYNKIIVSSN